MQLDPTFSYDPSVAPTPVQPVPAAGDLGPLAVLPGIWKGQGFNTIWRPNLPTPANPQQDRFLELNVTDETIEFDAIAGDIPNRGLLQGDLFMAGVRYLQQISDANINLVDSKNAGLHVEPGLWLSVPPTADPLEPATVARLASIPHGTTIVAQGVAVTSNGPPTIPPVSIVPFTIGQPAALVPFPEQTLTNATPFRSAVAGLTFPITQPMVDDPNSVLTAALPAGISTTTTLIVSTDSTPTPGGGTSNTAFLQGASGGPNADAAKVTAVFWLETVPDQPPRLQYTQTVLLNFNGLSWPHVTVATLVKQ